MNRSENPFSPSVAPIAQPDGSVALQPNITQAPTQRVWKDAPEVVKQWAFWITIFGVFVGGVLSVISFLMMSNDSLWWGMGMLAFGATSLGLFITHLFALRRGWKFGYYFQLVWSIGNFVIMALSLLALIFFFRPEPGAASAGTSGFSFPNIFPALAHGMILLGWFKPEVKRWFGVNIRRDEI